MTDMKDNGGPAFPILKTDTHDTWPGMTLRDYFAGQALAGLTGMAVSDGSDFLHPLGVRSAAQWAYSFADAMLSARA